MFAVIETGGKQYRVAQGDKVKVEKIKADKNGGFVFDKVLLVNTGKEVKVGTPHVAGAKVEAKVLRDDKAKTIVVFKYKPKKRYRVKKGHRQEFTEVEIVKISG